MTILHASKTAEETPMLESSEKDQNSPSAMSNPEKALYNENGISGKMTYINFIRGMVGPGCFSIPLSLKFAGFGTGITLLCIIGYVATLNMGKLVRTSQYLTVITGSKALNYGNMVGKAFEQGPRSLRKHSSKAKFLVNSCLCALQLGVCAVGYIFTTEHLKDVLDVLLTPNSSILTQAVTNQARSPGFSMPLLILQMSIPFSLLVSIRSFKILSYVSLFGNVLMLAALAIIFQVFLLSVTNFTIFPFRGLLRTSPTFESLPNFTSFSGLILATGSILYAYEGHAVVLPLENQLRDRRQMNGLLGVLSLGMSTTTFIYAFCGITGYRVYGSSVRGSITLNMPDTSLYFFVKILLTIVIFTGFLIQHFVLLDMYFPEMKAMMKKRKWSDSRILLVEYANRYAIVLFTMILSLLVPNLAAIIPLVGASCGMLLAMIIPPIIETVAFYPRWLSDGHGVGTTSRLIINASIATFGLIFMILGVKSNLDTPMVH
ncbi:unnamed protein product, partial [Mesorhabditis belari]|uniref:Amino acid transporter transmembrane domain-containing protein n=1 Tax=Mesorhabditis belari TaxID=2138241 RepID=A0AAF3FD86_9BILA